MISLNVPTVPRLTFDLYPGVESELESQGKPFWTKHLTFPGVMITLFCHEAPPQDEPLFDSDDVSAMERVAKIAERIRGESVPDWQRRGFLRAEKPSNDEHSFGL